MHDPGTSQPDAAGLAHKVMRIAQKHRCAIFVDAFGQPYLTNRDGPHFASTAFRYLNGLVGVYDQRAKIADIVDDIMEAWPAIHASIDGPK